MQTWSGSERERESGWQEAWLLYPVRHWAQVLSITTIRSSLSPLQPAPTSETTQEVRAHTDIQGPHNSHKGSHNWHKSCGFTVTSWRICLATWWYRIWSVAGWAGRECRQKLQLYSQTTPYLFFLSDTVFFLKWKNQISIRRKSAEYKEMLSVLLFKRFSSFLSSW